MTTMTMTMTRLGGLVLAATFLLTPVAAAPLAAATQGEAAERADAPTMVVQDLMARADTVEAVYRRARTLLNEGRYDEAADLFAQLRAEYEASQYVPETYYFEALARYRTEQRVDMERAMRLLESQRNGFPNAATARESELLLARIRAELAQRGSASAERAVAQEMEQLERQLAMAETQARAEAAQRAQVAQQQSQVAQQQSQVAQELAASQEVLARQSAELQEACEAEWEVRAIALQALYRMDPDRGNDMLRDIMSNRDRCAATVREMALWLLAERAGANDAEARDLLIALALEDAEQDSDVREVALMVLAQSDDDAAFEALTRMVEQSAGDELDEELYFALAMTGRAEAAETLERLLLAGDVADEEALVYALAETGGTEVLRRVYSRLDTDARVAVVWAVANEEGDDARAWFEARLADPNEDPEIRAAALYRLADEGNVSMPAVLELYRTIEDDDVRQEALWVLAQMDSDGDPGPRIEALIEIVRSEENSDLRQAALHALTEIDDPRVAAFLEVFLRGGGGA